MDISSSVQEFSKLTFEKQKEKLIAMLEQIKDSDPMFLDLFALLQKGENLDSDFLIGIYQDIMEFGQAIQTYNKTQQQTALSSIQNKIQEMHEREAKERATEQIEIDELIKNI